MIDIHSHIIPSVDDGFDNINEALDVIRKAKDSGITKIIATPHFLRGTFENYKSDILAKVSTLNNLLKVSNVKISVICGSEIMICPDVIDLLKADKLCTLNNSRYILIEFPMDVRVHNILKTINDILVAGFIPIIVHPERYRYIQKNIKEAISYVESGALLQLNINSIIGDYGDEVKAAAVKLLKHNLIHLWGSDTHSFRHVYGSKLEKCFNELKKIVGEDKFKQIVYTNPECVVNDEDIKTFDIKYKIGLFSKL